ncbi:MAG: cytochrome P450 [Tumebacillaceae bacterium]
MKELTEREDRLFPFPIYEQLRETAPVRYDASREAWDVFRFEDVHRILKDHETFSSKRGTSVRQENLLIMDPPKHTQMRDIVNKAFTPKSINDQAEKIAAITNELLDAVIERGEMDVVRDLAYPLPVIVIADMLGVPPEDRKFFKEWSDTLVKGPDVNTDEAFAAVIAERQAAQKELNDYFGHIIEARRKQPQDDLVTALVNAEINGEHLTDQELKAFCSLLLVAGNETTTNLITNSIRYFTEDAEVQTQVRNNPDLIPSTVEEVLRYYPPIVAIGRIATKDVEIGGQLIKAGDTVVSWSGSANRDEAKFADPTRFIPDRKPNPHLGFGFGIHFCLGAPLARLEAQVALKNMLERLPNMQFVHGTELQPIPSPFVFGVKQYPITFDVK